MTPLKYAIILCGLSSSEYYEMKNMKLPSASAVVRDEQPATAGPSHHHVKHATRPADRATETVAAATVSADANPTSGNDNPAEFYLYVTFGSVAVALVTVVVIVVVILCVCRRKNYCNDSLRRPCCLATGSEWSSGQTTDSATEKSDTGLGETRNTWQNNV